MCRSFGSRQVLKDIDLSLARGELLGVVGPNGGGKSTLLRLMAGILKPSSGTVAIEEHDPRVDSAHVGLVTAQPGLYPLLTGRENLHHFGELAGLTTGEIDSKLVPLSKLLQFERFDDRVAALSTGMQQKLSLMRALLRSPKVLLLDEPTANLDPLAAQAFYAEIRQRADEGMTCVWVTHELAAAESLCNRVVLIDTVLKKEIRLETQRLPPVGPLLDAWRKTVGAA